MHDMSFQRIPADLGQDLGPEQPVHGANAKDAQANHAVQVVRQALVDVLVAGGGNEGRDDEVDVGEEEEDRDGDAGAHRWLPGVDGLRVRRGRGVGPAPVEGEETDGYEEVDDAEGVRDHIED